MNPLRVFLSHTSELRAYPSGRSYVDLAERAVMAAGHVVVDMKDFPSIDEAPADVCIQRIESCNIYLGLFGTRWGTPVRGQPEVSYTELEFDAASKQKVSGKPMQRLIFVLDDNAVDTGIPPKALIDLDHPGQQERFLQKVRESSITCQTFSNPDQLAQLIERSLNELSVRPGTGKQPISLITLDAWVEKNLSNLERSFLGIPSVQQRRVHVPLDVRITYSASGEQTAPQILQPDMLTSVIISPMSETLLISGDGGTGKTSLAFLIASWLLHSEPDGRRRIPILIETALAEGETVIGRIGQWIKAQISGNEEDVSPELVEALMRYKRIVLLLDHVSELPKPARKRLLRNLPAGLVIATSRSFDDDWQERPLTRIEPLQIATDRLQSFFIDYLRRKSQQDVLNDEDLIPAQNQLRLIVGDKPITALLAQMFIDDVVAKKQQGVLAGSVPELMLSYIKRMDTPADEAMRKREGLTIDTELVQRTLKLLALASHRQGPSGKPRYQPLVFPGWLADRVLEAKEGGALKKAEQRQALLNYCLELNLLNHPGMDTGEFCFPLDPLADYLAALCQLEELEVVSQTNADSWNEFLCQLEQRPEDERQLMRGFLLALRDCCQERSFHRVLSMPQDTPDRLGRLAFLNPTEERYRLALQRARKWMWELGVPVESERRDAISRLAAMAATGGDDPEKRAVQHVATERLRLTCRDNGLTEHERAEAIVVLGLLGDVDRLRLFLDEDEQPVVLRRAAAEAIGLALRGGLGVKAQRTALLKYLSACLERERLQVTICTEDDWRQVDARLPLQQGLARGIHLASSTKSCGWVDGPGLAMPMLQLKAISADTGFRLTTEVSKIPVWSLPLPNHLFIEVVRIPAGRYCIGSNDDEAERTSYEHAPECTGVDVEQLRMVEVNSFLMGRFPVSQAQWAAVASLPVIQRELSGSPSVCEAKSLWEIHATPGELPVDHVHWEDCQEWLARLNLWLGKHMKKRSVTAPIVSLPSESQWEVACRCGERSIFSYGDILDTSWANYDGSFRYGTGRESASSNKTTCLGAYGVVNAWGLGEMNGHLFEWCQDAWHPSPSKAPKDGSAQLEQDPSLAGSPSIKHRVMRGGSWSNGPRFCRSSFRISANPTDKNAVTGFRVVVSVEG